MGSRRRLTADLRRIASSLLLSIPVVGAACSDGGPGGATTANERTAAATFSPSLPSFADNSIQICGDRDLPADGKYRCASSMNRRFKSTLESPGSCPCFDFDDRGNLIHPETGGEAVVDGLCPSDNVPAANWTFTYRIFEKRGCKGAQLNDGANNLTCYDANDLAHKGQPNKTVEPLAPGRNVNHIVCVTENASKAWHFDSCADITTSDDGASRSRYDCGCTPTPAAKGHPSHGCQCPGGLSALPHGCSFDASTCDVVCKGK